MLRVGKGQQAGVIQRSVCNVPLLISVGKHRSATACGGAAGTLWSFAAACSPFSPTVIPVP